MSVGAAAAAEGSSESEDAIAVEALPDGRARSGLLVALLPVLGSIAKLAYSHGTASPQ